MFAEFIGCQTKLLEIILNEKLENCEKKLVLLFKN